MIGQTSMCHAHHLSVLWIRWRVFVKNATNILRHSLNIINPSPKYEHQISPKQNPGLAWDHIGSAVGMSSTYSRSNTTRQLGNPPKSIRFCWRIPLGAGTRNGPFTPRLGPLGQGCAKPGDFLRCSMEPSGWGIPWWSIFEDVNRRWRKGDQSTRS